MPGRGIHRFLIFGLVLGSVLLQNCRKKEEPAPTIEVLLASTVVKEGDTLDITNKTKNARTYLWEITKLNYSSTDAHPQIIIPDAGSYILSLTAKNGDGKVATASYAINVSVDTLYRLCKRSSKTWKVKSIQYNSLEMLSEACQKDNEIVIVKSSEKDSFIMTEGPTVCPAGTNAFDLPASDRWRISKKNTFDLALVFLGNPFNLSFVFVKLSNETLEGYDAINDVRIFLEQKP